MSGHDKVNVLMVDDHPAKLLSYEAILQDLGENLIKAGSGTEALEHLLKTDIAVVLLDVSMPELDGFALAEMIREHPRFRQVAIIFISAVHLTDLDRLKGYQRGAVDYISVPVNPELLRARVSIFAELHRKNRQLENLNQQLRLLSTTLINMQDDERRRIARELHDGLGQDLVAATMLVDRITSQKQLEPPEQEAAVHAGQVIQRALQQVRSMSYLLHPPLLDEIGLCSALRWYVEGAGKRTDVDLSIEIQPEEFPRMEPQLETAVFRIVQEALTNVWRHSEASKATVTLEHKDRRIRLTVRDDGKGIGESVERFRPGSIGVGLGGMMHRAKEMGGEMRIRNANPGTVVEVIVPAKQAQGGVGAGAVAEEVTHPNAAN